MVDFMLSVRLFAVKLENIMKASKDPDAEVKIIDFGLATKYLSDDYKNMTDRVGTVYTVSSSF